MTIDLVGVILVIALCGLFLCIALWLARDREAPEPGTAWWIASFAALAAGFCVNGLQSLLPPLLGLTGGSTLLVAGVGMLLVGTQRFVAAPIHHEPWVLAAVLANAGASIALIYLWPSVNGRIAVCNALLAAMLAAYAWTLVRHAPRELYGPSRLMAAAGIVIAVMLVVRALGALAAPPMASALEANLVNVLVYFASALAQLALGLGSYFMLMIRRHAALKALSATDPLTGSLNRRGLDVATSRAEHDFRRTSTVYSVIALDLDHFKRVNDTYGHAAGDAVLQRLAAESRGKLRGDSVIARLGGEEFCILLPGCKCEDAHAVAERIRVAFADAPIESGQVVIHCTVSMGVAQCHADAADFASVCKEADAALYRAKNGGRNRVEKCPVPMEAIEPG
jgi:diguanylate cyclase (GGDEF)-like protein